LRFAKKLDQPRFAWGEVITPSLRDHERERTEVPSAAFKFDELSTRQILADEVSRQVPPAETGLEKITLGAEIIDQPQALAGNSLLGLFRFWLVVRNDDLNMSAKLVHRYGFRCRSERMGWRTYRHHLRLAQPAAFHGIRVHLRHVLDRDRAVFADELIQVVGMSWDGRGSYQEWMRQKDDETAD